MISEADRQKLVRLGLLEEASREIAESMDEIEIMQRTVRAVVNRFGYAEAAISLLVDEHQMEIAAIDGTEDIGFKPGYRQMVGEGIIGHTAETRSVYMTGDIENDSFYYSIGKRSGSAACVPMLSSGQLLGVLYVESVEKNAFVQDDIQTLETLVSHAVTAIQKARLFDRARAQLRAITTMQSVSQTILSSLELPDIFQSVVQLLLDNFNYTYVSIYMLQGDVLRLGAQAGYPDEMILHEIPVTSGITGRSVQTRQIQFVQNVSADPAFLRASNDIESEICVPLLKDDQVLGVINVEAAPGHPLTEDDVALLTVLRGPILIAIENAHLHSRVKQLALTDGLTGLYNRRAFDEMLESEIERASRYNHPLTLVIIDMDNFKDYNDLWGHPAGDERLESVADLLHSNLRSPDIVARYGGEEFAMILPNTAKSSALVLAERLRVTAEACAAQKDE
nr:diguanylate cyclase [Anaerolinea sp.]